MKNKFKATLTFVAIAISFFSAYQFNAGINGVSENPLIQENIDALSTNSESGLNIYDPHSSPCPPPVEYKKSVSCPRGDKAPDCMPSDC